MGASHVFMHEIHLRAPVREGGTGHRNGFLCDRLGEAGRSRVVLLELRSGRNFSLAWPTPRPLPGDNCSLNEQFSPPHAPRFTAVDCPGEAFGPHGA
jgi:hypothetical protein